MTLPTPEKPKPCPFCGDAEPMWHHSGMDNASRIICAQCDMSGPLVYGGEPEAIAAWNRRAK